MTPATPPTPDAAPAPVFVDDTGRRHRVVRLVGWALGVVMLAYLALLGISLVGSPGLVPLSLPAIGRVLPGPAAPQIGDATHVSRSPGELVSRTGSVTGGGSATGSGAAVAPAPAGTPARTTTQPTAATTPRPTSAPTPAATPTPQANPSPAGSPRPTHSPSAHPTPKSTHHSTHGIQASPTPTPSTT